MCVGGQRLEPLGSIPLAVQISQPFEIHEQTCATSQRVRCTNVLL